MNKFYLKDKYCLQFLVVHSYKKHLNIIKYIRIEPHTKSYYNKKLYKKPIIFFILYLKILKSRSCWPNFDNNMHFLRCIAVLSYVFQ